MRLRIRGRILLEFPAGLLLCLPYNRFSNRISAVDLNNKGAGALIKSVINSRSDFTTMVDFVSLSES